MDAAVTNTNKSSRFFGAIKSLTSLVAYNLEWAFADTNSLESVNLFLR